MTPEHIYKVSDDIHETKTILGVMSYNLAKLTRVVENQASAQLSNNTLLLTVAELERRLQLMEDARKVRPN